jgi:hypothetical protein
MGPCREACSESVDGSINAPHSDHDGFDSDEVVSGRLPFPGLQRHRVDWAPLGHP